jgi:hypothetical protein
MNRWKVLGLAGLAGVTAAGVIIAREQRQRTQLAPEEIRARLQQRLEQARSAPNSGMSRDSVAGVSVSPTTRRWWLLRRSSRGGIRGNSLLSDHLRQP